MSAARKPQSQPMEPGQAQRVASVIALVGVVAGVLLVWAQYPGAIVAWLACWVASFMSQPVAFSGAKAPGGGDPLPAGEWERDLARRHRMWMSLRGRLWFPAGLWPGREFALLPLVGVAVAAIVVGLPTAGVGFVWEPVPGSEPFVVLPLPDEVASVLVWVNVWCAVVLAVEVPAALSRFASDFSPRPLVSVAAVRQLCGSAQQWVWVAVAAGLGAAAGWLSVLLLRDRVAAVWVSLPIVQAAGAALLGAVVAVVCLFRRRLDVSWSEQVEAAKLWRDMWLSPELKMPSVPELVGHETLWDGRIIVDTFIAPPGIGSAGMLEFRKNSYGELLARLFGSQETVVVLDACEIDTDGVPRLGTRDQLRFRVARRITEEVPSLADARVSMDVARITLEMFAAASAAEVKSVPPLLMEFESIVSPPVAAGPSEDAADVDDDVLMESAQPQVEPELDWTAAWCARFFDVGGQGAVAKLEQLLPYLFGDATDVEAVSYGDRLYVGAVTADSTPLMDPSLRDRLSDLQTISLWKQRWADTVVAAGIPAGAAPHDALTRHVREFVVDMRPNDDRMGAARLGRGLVKLTAVPFQMMQGVNLNDYFRPRVEAALVTAVSGAPFLHCAGFLDYSPGAGEGVRRKDILQVVWSEQHFPTNPAKIPGSLSPKGGPDRVAARFVFAGLVAHAFDAARFVRPEVIDAEQLAGVESRESVWRVRVRLYGGVTLDDLRKKLQTLRSKLGCEWLQVTGTLDADVVVFGMGADPRASSVVFGGPYGEKRRAWCEQVRWESAFLDAKLVGTNGDAPQMLSTGLLPDNPRVQEHEFSVPAGRSLMDFVNATSSLSASLSVAFIEARPTANPSTVRVLSCPEDPMPMPAPVDWGAMLDMSNPNLIPFGTNSEGVTVGFDLKFDPHLLVLGGTGTGKSITLSVFLEAFLLRGFECVLADPVKGGADFQFAKPWMRALTGDLFETLEMLKWVSAEKDRRKQLNAECGVGSIADLPVAVRPKPMLVVLDEFTSLMLAERPEKPTGDESPEELQALEQLRAEFAAKRSIGTKVGQLAREARSAGIHLVLATQALKADTLKRIGGGDLKTNLARYALGSMSFGDLQSALRKPMDAAHLRVPAGVKGRGIFEVNQAGGTQVVQSWYAADSRRGLSHTEVFTAALEEHLPRVAPEDRLDLSALVEQASREVSVFGEELAEPTVDDVAVVDLGELDASELSFADGTDAGFVAGDVPVEPVEVSGAGMPVDDVPDEVDPSVEAPMVWVQAAGVVCWRTFPQEFPDAVPLPDGDGSWWVSPSLLQRLGALRVRVGWIGDAGLCASLTGLLGRDLENVPVVGRVPEPSASVDLVLVDEFPNGLGVADLVRLEDKYGSDTSAPELLVREGGEHGGSGLSLSFSTGEYGAAAGAPQLPRLEF